MDQYTWWNPADVWAATASDYAYDEFLDQYYGAFTKTTQVEREESMAAAFYTLGHMMHLLQDMASPEHVRDDMHPSADLYFSAVERYADQHYTLEMIRSLPVASVPVVSTLRSLFDSGQWGGPSPAPLGTSLGLAEYTNVNCLSTHTTDFGWRWPRPALDETEIPRRFEALGSDGRRIGMRLEGTQDVLPGPWESIRKFAVRPWAEGITHFAVARRVQYGGQDPFFPYGRMPDQVIVSINDDQVLKDYCDMLLPQAVAYSTAMVNYCFRGKIAWGNRQCSHGEGTWPPAIYNDTHRYSFSDSGYTTLYGQGYTIGPGSFELYEIDDGGNASRLAVYDYPGVLSPGDHLHIDFTPGTVPCCYPGDSYRHFAVFRGLIGQEQGVAVSHLYWIGTFR